MNLWLSPHGIWYYRKVTTLPCGRRKEIKKSLHTRDKLMARHKVTQLLACVRSRPKPIQLPADATVDPQEQCHPAHDSGNQTACSAPVG
ncbi:hypothetical protein [Aeromonas bivalvium]|uniref:hypothetical protein n=1 Tax=Aeromonas bivalvium TaxID=440079 RepID=UPI0038CFD4A8